jgi:type VI secretion system secreted protein Hcp
MSIYMKVTGHSELEGHVTGKGLEKTTQLLSADFTLSRNINTRPGSVDNREGARPSIGDFQITKNVDQISPYLMRDATTGTSIPVIEIKFVNTGSDLNVYHVIRLENVLISSYGIHAEGNTAAGANEKPSETLTLDFTKITVTNTPFGKDHKAGSPITAGYDLETAQPL